MHTPSQFTIGVEEEYMVIDPVTRELTSHEQRIVIEGQKTLKDKVKAEMHQAVVEVGTDICGNIEEAHKEVTELRNIVSSIAGDLNLWVGASGTHPFSHWQHQLITDHVRYNQIVNELQDAARSNLIFDYTYTWVCRTEKWRCILPIRLVIFYPTYMHLVPTLLFGKVELPDTNLTEPKCLINFQEQVSQIILKRSRIMRIM